MIHAQNLYNNDSLGFNFGCQCPINYKKLSICNLKITWFNLSFQNITIYRWKLWLTSTKAANFITPNLSRTNNVLMICPEGGATTKVMVIKVWRIHPLRICPFLFWHFLCTSGKFVPVMVLEERLGGVYPPETLNIHRFLIFLAYKSNIYPDGGASGKVKNSRRKYLHPDQRNLQASMRFYASSHINTRI